MIRPPKQPGQAKHKIAPVIRAAFLRGLDIIEQKRGMTFSQLMAEEIEKAGLLVVLDKVGRYVEKEASVDVTTNGESLVDVLGSLNTAIQRARDDLTVEEEPGPLRH